MHLIRITAVAACACSAHANIATYSNWDNLETLPSTFYAVRNDGRPVGLTFQAAVTGEITSISVPLILPISAGLTRFVGFEVWTLDQNGAPGTSIALGGGFLTSAGQNTPARFDISAQSPALLQAGQTYALTLISTGLSGAFWLTSPMEPQGSVVSLDANGQWQVRPAAEAGAMPAAQIFVVPAPGALALLALAALPTRRRR